MLRPVARRQVPLLGAVALLVIGSLGGFLGERRLAADRHAATAEVLTGRVAFSNPDGRWIVFYPDGVADSDNDADWIWYVIAEGWQDTAGTYHGGGDYPSCLASDGTVAADPARVELTSIDWDNGSRQPMHVALRVRCLS